MSTRNKIQIEEMMGGITNQPGEAPTPTVPVATADLLAVELRKYEDLKRFRADTDILDFWKSQKLSSPLLSNLALTILSIPITEVDVERLFSNLTFVHTKLRNCLTDKMISDILFLRMSSKQDFEIDDEEILY